MKVWQKIKDVDLNYPVEDIKVNGRQFWPFFRVFFFDMQKNNGDSKVRLSISQKLNLALSMFYGFFNWFAKTDYLVFSNSDQRKELGGQFIDKSADYINQRLPNTLHIELPVFTHYPISKLKYKKIVSHLPLRFIEVLYSKFFLKNVDIQGREVLEKLFKDYQVSTSISEIAKRFTAQYIIMKWFLNLKKPKAVFMAVPYMKMGYVLAARDLGIKVIEMQHGVVNRSHFGYANYKKFNENLFPNYLLAYGADVKNTFKDGNITFSIKNVFEVGHYYLDLIEKSDLNLGLIPVSFNKAKISFSVSLQDGELGNQVVDLLIEVAKMRPDWVFVFVPRRTPISEYKKLNLPKNIIFIPELNVYQIINLCDVHTTLNSTCAIEAPTLGKPNVLVNIENRSKDYYGSILLDSLVTRFVVTADQFITEVEKDSFPKTDAIKESNSKIINTGFDYNLDYALTQIGERSNIDFGSSSNSFQRLGKET